MKTFLRVALLLVASHAFSQGPASPASAKPSQAVASAPQLNKAFWFELNKIRYALTQKALGHEERDAAAWAAYGEEFDAEEMRNDVIADVVALKATKTKEVAKANAEAWQQEAAKLMANLPSQLAPANDASTGPPGSLAQTDAVPASVPVAQSAVNAGIVSTQTGTRLISSLSLNPWGMLSTAVATRDEKARAQGTLATRLFDVGLVLPMDMGNNARASGRLLDSFDFIGARMRINLRPTWGENLYKRVAEDYAVLLGEFGQALQKAGTLHQRLEKVLAKYEKAHEVQKAAACLEAIDAEVAMDIVDKCEEVIPELMELSKLLELFYGRIESHRNAFDAYYVGLDLRYDYGDPTFSNLADARGHYTHGNVAVGYRGFFGNPYARRRWFWSLRALGEWSLFKPGRPTHSLGYTGGAEVGLLSGLKVYKLSVGVDGRHALRAAPRGDTNFVDLRVGLGFPLSDGSQLGVVVSVPLWGAHDGISLGLAGNWNTLLGALKQPH